MPVTYATVEAFLHDQAPERRELISTLREIVLTAREDVVEIVKWNSPSYLHDGMDRITINARSKDAVRLILHVGVSTPHDKQASRALVDDPDALLHWHSNDRASITVKDAAEADVKREAITHLVGTWLDSFA